MFVVYKYVLFEAVQSRNLDAKPKQELVAQACNPKTQEAGAGVMWVQDQPGLPSELLFQKHVEQKKRKEIAENSSRSQMTLVCSYDPTENYLG